MGKLKEHPRYNVLSFRVTDQELTLIQMAAAGNMSGFLHTAVTEKVDNDRQARLGKYLREQPR